MIRAPRSLPLLLTAAALSFAGAAVGPVSAASAQTVLASATPPGGLTSKEEIADRIWTLRAGFYVAALQCQFSRFLATVPLYNALLQQHSGEFSDSFKTLTGYFVRHGGPRAGQRAFDTYATRTSQSWSTFDAQVSFCTAAAALARRALMVPKGKLGEFASAELATFRSSLVYEPPRTPEVLLPRQLVQFAMPNFEKCDRKGRCRWEDKSWFTGLRPPRELQRQADAQPADRAARPPG